MSTTVKLIYNAIFAGKWVNAGESIPKDSLPPSLHKYIAPAYEPADDDDPKEINLARKYGQVYSVDSAGRIGHPVKRQMAEMAAVAEQNDALEQEIADAPIDPAVAAAIEEARENYQADVRKQIANSRIAAEHADDVKDAVREEHDLASESGEFDEMDVPREEPKPKRPVVSSKAVVKREGRFVLASCVALVAGEKLYRQRKRSFGVSERYIAFAKVRSERKI